MSSLAFRPDRRREKITLSVTPLIDVLFLLIIFFMLTGTFERLAELELSLPDSRSAEIGGERQDDLQLELVATADGRLFLDEEEMDAEDLGERLRAALKERPGRTVLLSAESAVEHGRVVELLDLVREAGFAGVGIGTRPAPPAAARERDP